MKAYRERLRAIAEAASLNPELDEELELMKLWGDYQRHLLQLVPPLPGNVLELAALSVHDGFPSMRERTADGMRLVLCIGDLHVGYEDLEISYQGIHLTDEDERALDVWLRERSDADVHVFDRTEEGLLRQELLIHGPPSSVVICARGITWETTPRQERAERDV